MHKKQHLRTPQEIRLEMAKLNAPRPDHVRTAQDWLRIERFNELYAEWIDAITNHDVHHSSVSD